MNRRVFAFLLAVAAVAQCTVATVAVGANASFSLNLAFNTPGNLNSGGTWTTVAKVDPQGLAGATLNLANATTFGSFLAPPQLDVQMQGLFGSVRNVVVGDDLTPPLPLGIGVIGSSFPSTYVDPAGLIPFGSYPNLGSFTGGVALATGSFAPGVIPDWTSNGINPPAGANLFTGPSSPVAAASVLLTVRYAVPEPTTCAMFAMCAVALGVARRVRG